MISHDACGQPAMENQMQKTAALPATTEAIELLTCALTQGHAITLSLATAPCVIRAPAKLQRGVPTDSCFLCFLQGRARLSDKLPGRWFKGAQYWVLPAAPAHHGYRGA